MKTTLQLSGLDCAHCAAELEQDVQKIQGVLSASVSFIHQKLTLEYQSEQVLLSVIELVNHFEQVKVVEENAPQSEKKQKAGEPSVERAQDITLKNDFIFIALSALLFFAAIALGYLPVGVVVSMSPSLRDLNSTPFSLSWLIRLSRSCKDLPNREMLST